MPPSAPRVSDRKPSTGAAPRPWAAWWAIVPCGLLLFAATLGVAIVITTVAANADPVHDPRSNPFTTLTAWYQVEGFETLIAWSGIALLTITAGMLGTISARQPARWWGSSTICILLLAALVQLVATIFPEWELRTNLELAASSLAALAALLAVAAFFFTLIARAGYDMGHVFLFAACEWLLVGVSADVFFHYKNLGPHLFVPAAARDQIFTLLFFGFLGNLFLGLNLRLAGTLLNVTAMRPRAWLLAAGVFNVGIILLALPSAEANAAGAGLAAVAIVFYLAGLGALRSATKARRPGAMSIRNAWWAFLLAALFATLEPIVWTRPIARFDAWEHTLRHLLVFAVAGGLMLGGATRLAALRTPAEYLPRRLLQLVGLSYVIGLATWLLGACGTILGAPGAFDLIALGAIIQVATITFFGLAGIRAWRYRAAGTLWNQPASASNLRWATTSTALVIPDSPHTTLGEIALLNGTSVESVIA
jgi:hypothetical protein